MALRGALMPMVGDLLSSFLKRQMGLPPSGRAIEASFEHWCESHRSLCQGRLQASLAFGSC